MQFSDAVANAILEAMELVCNGQTLDSGVVTGVALQPKLQLRSGVPPLNCAAAATGLLLAEITLPEDWMANAGSRTKIKSGTWSTTGLAAAGDGTACGHYRIVDNAGTSCHEQGTVTVTDGGGDLTVDNVSIAENQVVSVTTKTWNASNNA